MTTALRFFLLCWLLLSGWACEKSLVGDPRWEFFSPAATGLFQNGQPDLEGRLYFNQGDLYLAGYVLLRFDGQNWEELYRNAPADYYTALAFAPDNRLWMARRLVNAAETRLQYYENDTWVEQPFPDSLSSLQVRDFYFESTDRFYLATNGGLLRYDAGIWTLQNSSNSSLGSDDLHRILSWQNRLFVFKTGSLPLLFEQQGSNWLPQTGPLPSPLNDVRLDAQGRFWLAGAEVARWNIEENSWTTWSAERLGLQGAIRRIAPRGENFWLATRNGLLEYKSEELRRYTSNNSRIVSNICIDIRFDTEGALWMSLGNDTEAGYQSGLMRFQADAVYLP